ncbi:MAG: helix-turn-helix domain-containing protein, partial [Candidatus Omnitrophota bacterium]
MDDNKGFVEQVRKAGMNFEVVTGLISLYGELEAILKYLSLKEAGNGPLTVSSSVEEPLDHCIKNHLQHLILNEANNPLVPLSYVSGYNNILKLAGSGNMDIRVLLCDLDDTLYRSPALRRVYKSLFFEFISKYFNCNRKEINILLYKIRIKLANESRVASLPYIIRELQANTDGAVKGMYRPQAEPRPEIVTAKDNIREQWHKFIDERVGSSKIRLLIEPDEKLKTVFNKFNYLNLKDSFYLGISTNNSFEQVRMILTALGIKLGFSDQLIFTGDKIDPNYFAKIIQQLSVILNYKIEAQNVLILDDNEPFVCEATRAGMYAQLVRGAGNLYGSLDAILGYLEFRNNCFRENKLLASPVSSFKEVHISLGQLLRDIINLSYLIVAGGVQIIPAAVLFISFSGIKVSSGLAQPEQDEFFNYLVNVEKVSLRTRRYVGGSNLCFKIASSPLAPRNDTTMEFFSKDYLDKLSLPCRIEVVRKCLGLSQQELARRMGVSEKFICECEDGSRLITVRFLRRLVGEFNLDMVIFLPPQWVFIEELKGLKTLADKLFRSREYAGKTLQEIAEAAGMSEPTVRRYETGKSFPSRKYVEDFARALGIPVENYCYELHSDMLFRGRKGRAGSKVEGISPQAPPVERQFMTAVSSGIRAALLTEIEDVGQAPGNKDENSLPGKIKYVRKKILRLTQEGLGSKTGVSKCMVYRYEKGTNSPPVSFLQSLARIAGLNITYFQPERTEDIKALPTLARKLREFRELAGKAQHEIAEATGVSQPTVRRYESGELFPSEEYVKKFSQEVKVEFAVFCYEQHRKDFCRQPRRTKRISGIDFKVLAFNIQIKTARENKGMSQQTLADKMKVPVGKVREIEAGDIPLPLNIKFFRKLARCLGINFSKLSLPKTRTEIIKIRKEARKKEKTKKQKLEKRNSSSPVDKIWPDDLAGMIVLCSSSVIKPGICVNLEQLTEDMGKASFSSVRERILYVLKQKGIRLSELARETGYSVNIFVQKKGLRPRYFPAHEIAKIAESLSVTEKLLDPGYLTEKEFIDSIRELPLSKQLAKARRYRGLTYDQISIAIKYNSVSVHRNEKGYNPVPNKQYLEKFAKAVNIPKETFNYPSVIIREQKAFSEYKWIIEIEKNKKFNSVLERITFIRKFLGVTLNEINQATGIRKNKLIVEKKKPYKSLVAVEIEKLAVFLGVSPKILDPGFMTREEFADSLKGKPLAERLIKARKYCGLKCSEIGWLTNRKAADVRYDEKGRKKPLSMEYLETFARAVNMPVEIFSQPVSSSIMPEMANLDYYGPRDGQSLRLGSVVACVSSSMEVNHIRGPPYDNGKRLPHTVSSPLRLVASSRILTGRCSSSIDRKKLLKSVEQALSRGTMSDLEGIYNLLSRYMEDNGKSPDEKIVCSSVLTRVEGILHRLSLFDSIQKIIFPREIALKLDGMEITLTQEGKDSLIEFKNRLKDVIGQISQINFQDKDHLIDQIERLDDLVCLFGDYIGKIIKEDKYSILGIVLVSLVNGDFLSLYGDDSGEEKRTNAFDITNFLAVISTKLGCLKFKYSKAIKRREEYDINQEAETAFASLSNDKRLANSLRLFESIIERPCLELMINARGGLRLDVFSILPDARKVINSFGMIIQQMPPEKTSFSVSGQEFFAHDGKGWQVIKSSSGLSVAVVFQPRQFVNYWQIPLSQWLPAQGCDGLLTAKARVIDFGSVEIDSDMSQQDKIKLWIEYIEKKKAEISKSLLEELDWRKQLVEINWKELDPNRKTLIIQAIVDTAEGIRDNAKIQRLASDDVSPDTFMLYSKTAFYLEWKKQMNEGVEDESEESPAVQLVYRLADFVVIKDYYSANQHILQRGIVYLDDFICDKGQSPKEEQEQWLEFIAEQISQKQIDDYQRAVVRWIEQDYEKGGIIQRIIISPLWDLRNEIKIGRLINNDLSGNMFIFYFEAVLSKDEVVINRISFRQRFGKLKYIMEIQQGIGGILRSYFSGAKIKINCRDITTVFWSFLICENVKWDLSSLDGEFKQKVIDALYILGIITKKSSESLIRAKDFSCRIQEMIEVYLKSKKQTPGMSVLTTLLSGIKDYAAKMEEIEMFVAGYVDESRLGEFNEYVNQLIAIWGMNRASDWLFGLKDAQSIKDQRERSRKSKQSLKHLMVNILDCIDPRAFDIKTELKSFDLITGSSKEAARQLFTYTLGDGKVYEFEEAAFGMSNFFNKMCCGGKYCLLLTGIVRQPSSSAVIEDIKYIQWKDIPPHQEQWLGECPGAKGSVHLVKKDNYNYVLFLYGEPNQISLLIDVNLTLNSLIFFPEEDGFSRLLINRDNIGVELRIEDFALKYNNNKISPKAEIIMPREVIDYISSQQEIHYAHRHDRRHQERNHPERYYPTKGRLKNGLLWELRASSAVNTASIDEAHFNIKGSFTAGVREKIDHWIEKVLDFEEITPQGWTDPEQALWEDGPLARIVSPVHAAGLACAHILKWLAKIPDSMNKFLKMEADKESGFWIRLWHKANVLLEAVVKGAEKERDSSSCGFVIGEKLGDSSNPIKADINIDQVEKSDVVMSSNRIGGGVYFDYLENDIPFHDGNYFDYVFVGPKGKNAFADVANDQKALRAILDNKPETIRRIIEAYGGAKNVPLGILARRRNKEIIEAWIKAGMPVETEDFDEMMRKVEQSPTGMYINGGIVLINHGDLDLAIRGLISGKIQVLMGAGRASEAKAMAKLAKCIGGRFFGRFCNDNLKTDFTDKEQGYMRQCGIVRPGTEKKGQLPWDKVFTEDDLCGDGDIVIYYAGIRDSLFMPELKGPYVDKKTGDVIVCVLKLTRAGRPRIYRVRYETRISCLNKEIAALEQSLEEYERRLKKENISGDEFYERERLWREFGILDQALTEEQMIALMVNKLSDSLYNRAKAWDEFGEFNKALEDIDAAYPLLPERDKYPRKKYRKARNFFLGMNTLTAAPKHAKRKALKWFYRALDLRNKGGLINPAEMIKKLKFYLLNLEIPIRYLFGNYFMEISPQARERIIKDAECYNKLNNQLLGVYRYFPAAKERDKLGKRLAELNRKYYTAVIKDWNNLLEDVRAFDNQRFYYNLGIKYMEMQLVFSELGYSEKAFDFLLHAVSWFKTIPKVRWGILPVQAQLKVAQEYEKTGLLNHAKDAYAELLYLERFMPIMQGPCNASVNEMRENRWEVRGFIKQAFYAYLKIILAESGRGAVQIEKTIGTLKQMVCDFGGNYEELYIDKDGRIILTLDYYISVAKLQLERVYLSYCVNKKGKKDFLGLRASEETLLRTKNNITIERQYRICILEIIREARRRREVDRAERRIYKKTSRISSSIGSANNIVQEGLGEYPPAYAYPVFLSSQGKKQKQAIERYGRQDLAKAYLRRISLKNGQQWIYEVLDNHKLAENLSKEELERFLSLVKLITQRLNKDGNQLKKFYLIASGWRKSLVDKQGNISIAALEINKQGICLVIHPMYFKLKLKKDNALIRDIYIRLINAGIGQVSNKKIRELSYMCFGLDRLHLFGFLKITGRKDLFLDEQELRSLEFINAAGVIAPAQKLIELIFCQDKTELENIVNQLLELKHTDEGEIALLVKVLAFCPNQQAVSYSRKLLLQKTLSDNNCHPVARLLVLGLGQPAVEELFLILAKKSSSDQDVTGPLIKALYNKDRKISQGARQVLLIIPSLFESDRKAFRKILEPGKRALVNNSDPEPVKQLFLEMFEFYPGSKRFVSKDPQINTFFSRKPLITARQTDCVVITKSVIASSPVFLRKQEGGRVMTQNVIVTQSKRGEVYNRHVFSSAVNGLQEIINYLNRKPGMRNTILNYIKHQAEVEANIYLAQKSMDLIQKYPREADKLRNCADYLIKRAEALGTGDVDTYCRIVEFYMRQPSADIEKAADYMLICGGLAASEEMPQVNLSERVEALYKQCLNPDFLTASEKVYFDCFSSYCEYLMELKEYEKILSYIAELEEILPQNNRYLDSFIPYVRALVLSQQEKYEQAMVFYSRVKIEDLSGIFPGIGYYNLGCGCFNTEQYKQAKGYFEQALELYWPLSLEEHNKRQNVLWGAGKGIIEVDLQEGDFSAALRFYKQHFSALSAYPEIVSIIAQASDENKQLLKNERQADLFETAGINYSLTSQRDKLRKTDYCLRQAIILCEKDDALEDLTRLLYKLALIHLENKSYEQSQGYFLRALDMLEVLRSQKREIPASINPADFFHKLGEVFYRAGISSNNNGSNMECFVLAIEYWHRAVDELGPQPQEDNSKLKKALIYFDLAKLQTALGLYYIDHERIIQYFSEAISLLSGRAEYSEIIIQSYKLLSAIYNDLELPDLALSCLNKLEELGYKTKFFALNLLLMRCRNSHNKSIKQAEELLSEIDSLIPAQFVLIKAEVLLSQGDPRQAAEVLRKATLDYQGTEDIYEIFRRLIYIYRVEIKDSEKALAEAERLLECILRDTGLSGHEEIAPVRIPLALFAEMVSALLFIGQICSEAGIAREKSILCLRKAVSFFVYPKAIYYLVTQLLRLAERAPVNHIEEVLNKAMQLLRIGLETEAEKEIQMPEEQDATDTGILALQPRELKQLIVESGFPDKEFLFIKLMIACYLKREILPGYWQEYISIILEVNPEGTDLYQNIFFEIEPQHRKYAYKRCIVDRHPKTANKITRAFISVACEQIEVDRLMIARVLIDSLPDNISAVFKEDGISGMLSLKPEEKRLALRIFGIIGAFGLGEYLTLLEKFANLQITKKDELFREKLLKQTLFSIRQIGSDQAIRFLEDFIQSRHKKVQNRIQPDISVQARLAQGDKTEQKVNHREDFPRIITGFLQTISDNRGKIPQAAEDLAEAVVMAGRLGVEIKQYLGQLHASQEAVILDFINSQIQQLETLRNQLGIHRVFAVCLRDNFINVAILPFCDNSWLLKRVEQIKTGLSQQAGAFLKIKDDILGQIGQAK